MTYVKINGAWYKELQFKEEYTEKEKLYLEYIDLVHKKNLIIRLANNIDLLERMLSKLPKFEYGYSNCEDLSILELLSLDSIEYLRENKIDIG